jgi:hypothetical protein
MRRPHAMSLWFAGLGLLTLVGALFLSRTGDDIPTVDAADMDHQQVGSLQPVPSSISQPAGSSSQPVPGPAPETVEPGFVRPALLADPMGTSSVAVPVQPSPLLEGSEREQEPIGGVIQHGSGVAGSWKANHEPPRGTSSASEREPAKEKGRSASATKTRSTRAAETSSALADIESSGKATGSRPKARSRSAKKASEAAKKSADSKKPVDPKPPIDTEVDFGI